MGKALLPGGKVVEEKNGESALVLQKRAPLIECSDVASAKGFRLVLWDPWVSALLATRAGWSRGGLWWWPQRSGDQRRVQSPFWRQWVRRGREEWEDGAFPALPPPLPPGEYFSKWASFQGILGTFQPGPSAWGPWVGESECGSFGVVSQFIRVLWVSWTSTLLPFKARCFEGMCFRCKS